MKNLMSLNGVTVLSKKNQKFISGGGTIDTLLDCLSGRNSTPCKYGYKDSSEYAKK